MGCLDSTESSDLVGLFLLYNLTAYEEININRIGIYRDDGLMIVNKHTRRKVDKIRKIIWYLNRLVFM